MERNRQWRLDLCLTRGTKNHREHALPLTAAALALLPERREDRDLVFGTGDGAFSGMEPKQGAA